MRVWSDKTEIAADRFVAWIGMARGKFFAWKKRYGKANEHNGHVPRDHWLLDEEKAKIIAFHERFPLEGYRRLTFMMIDQEVVATSPSSVYRVLAGAGLLDRWNKKPSKKGTGFVQPLRPHEHWHIDISYLNLGGTFYYLCSILDGASRAIVHWEIRDQMTEADVECILVRAHEAHPDERPRIISDNGPQFIAKDFKEFIRLTGMTHVRTAPYYPQSNGNHQGGRHSARPAQDSRRGPRARRPLGRALQHRPPAQRDRLHHPGRPPRRSRPRDLGPARCQAGSRPRGSAPAPRRAPPGGGMTLPVPRFRLCNLHPVPSRSRRTSTGGAGRRSSRPGAGRAGRRDHREAPAELKAAITAGAGRSSAAGASCRGPHRRTGTRGCTWAGSLTRRPATRRT
jgi:hypothetical protein